MQLSRSAPRLAAGSGCDLFAYATLWICFGSRPAEIISDPLIMSGQLAQFPAANQLGWVRVYPIQTREARNSGLGNPRVTDG
jgi:hypothetical protein